MREWLGEIQRKTSGADGYLVWYMLRRVRCFALVTYNAVKQLLLVWVVGRY